MTTTMLPPPALSESPRPLDPHRLAPLEDLSRRELEVLTLMAEGRSNLAIGELLDVELKTVETHVSRVFTKLGLDGSRRQNRRVLAVLAFLGRAGSA